MAHLVFWLLLIGQLRSMLWTRLCGALLCCMAKRTTVSAMALIGVGHIFIGVWASVVALVASPTSIVSSIASIVAIPSSIVPMGRLLSLPGIRIPVTGRSLREGCYLIRHVVHLLLKSCLRFIQTIQSRGN